MNPDLDRRTLSYGRRLESFTPATDVIISLFEQALEAGHQASYVLFDSWFLFPKTIGRIHDLGLDMIGKLKDMPNIFYSYEGHYYRLSKLYSVIRKKRGRAKILASVIVTIKNPVTDLPMEVKIVFVRDRNNKSSWLSILSTDLTLTDEEIVRIYGKRWDIEVYFKMVKSYLKLVKEFQGRSYDMMTAHTTIVAMRYLLLALESREQLDIRSLGGMFYVGGELEDICLSDALLLIFELIKQALRKAEVLSEALL